MRSLFLLALLFFASQANAQIKHPSYETIIEKFFDTYDPPASDYKKVAFQKKPQGWHVATLEYDAGYFLPIKDVLFWEKESNTYKDLDFEPNSGDHQDYIDQLLGSSNAWLYDVSIYFGYDGWETDVIDNYGSKEETINDTLLYGLGRAYSSYASHLLGDQYGVSKTIPSFELERDELLNEDQLETYREYQHKAIGAFERLNNRNPDYETLIGDIGDKWTNQHVTAYFDLMIYSTEQEALTELRDDLYDDFYVALAKNYLNSCAPNAILFTGGDMDTYPLWYVQAKYGIRTDVTVMTLSLLNAHRTIDLLTRGSAFFPPLSLTLGNAHYDTNGPNAYLPFIGEPKDPVSIESYLEQINQKDESLRYEVEGGYYNLTPSLQFTLQTTGYFDQKQLPTALQEWATESQMIIKVKSGARGIEMKDLVLLDLLATNNWERPIYFNSTSLRFFNFELENHAVTQGLTLQFLPLNKPFPSAADHETMFVNLTEKFDWEKLSSNEVSKPSRRNFIVNYRWAINRLTEALLENNETEKARKVLLANYDWMPGNTYPWDHFNAEQISFLLQLNEKDQARKIATEIFDQATKELEAQYATGASNNDMEVRLNLLKLDFLGKAYEENGMPEEAKIYQDALIRFYDF